MTLKSSFLVGKAYLKKADACNHVKKMISISTQYYFLLFEIMYCSKDNIYCGISTYHNQQRFRIRSLLKERNVQFVLYNFPRKSLKYLAVTF